MKLAKWCQDDVGVLACTSITVGRSCMDAAKARQSLRSQPNIMLVSDLIILNHQIRSLVGPNIVKLTRGFCVRLGSSAPGTEVGQAAVLHSAGIQAQLDLLPRLGRHPFPTLKIPPASNEHLHLSAFWKIAKSSHGTCTVN